VYFDSLFEKKCYQIDSLVKIMLDTHANMCYIWL
jgi:hypothetical protein